MPLVWRSGNECFYNNHIRASSATQRHQHENTAHIFAAVCINAEESELCYTTFHFKIWRIDFIFVRFDKHLYFARAVGPQVHAIAHRISMDCKRIAALRQSLRCLIEPPIPGCFLFGAGKMAGL